MADPEDVKIHTPLYYPIELFKGCDWGPTPITLGLIAVDADGNNRYDAAGDPIIDPFDFSGFTFAAEINRISQSGTSTMDLDVSGIASGIISLSITDTNSTAIAAWMTTGLDKTTEKLAEYRVKSTDGSGLIRTEIYGPISMNVLGAA